MVGIFLLDHLTFDSLMNAARCNERVSAGGDDGNIVLAIEDYQM